MMFEINDLSVSVGEKKILKNINLKFELGKNYCILGKNGSGKSTLALTIMGHPNYKVDTGSLNIEGLDVLEMSPDKRAKLGIFLAFQQIPEIEGVKLFEFLRNIYNTHTGENTTFLKFKDIIIPLIQEVGLDKEFLRRDLNVGFSGGEKRKIEILQIKLLKPKYIFLDEIDSGLDVDAFKSITKMIGELNNQENCFVFITHHFEIIQNIDIDEVIILNNGEIKDRGDKKLIEKIKKEGFK
ncbi:MAG TPA: Fe-S cluster assembly ATPase SufC [Candidatus Absconditabacterales bacterium]|nr:Fe-S cluster assembly ATPase SufC [Candidatus Absconditabacterales bacterium]HPK28339.1 Fe-S cluster assembly ATPase SufC [Candidatus Absconditabacterales bacterium]